MPAPAAVRASAWRSIYRRVATCRRACETPSSPAARVIAITGGPTPSSRYRHAYQELEDFTQFDPVTKFNARIDDARRLPDLLRQAFREATSGCPGPAHLQIAGPHAQIAEGLTDLDTIVEQRFTKVPAFRPEPEPGGDPRGCAACSPRPGAPSSSPAAA